MGRLTEGETGSEIPTALLTPNPTNLGNRRKSERGKIRGRGVVTHHLFSASHSHLQPEYQACFSPSFLLPPSTLSPVTACPSWGSLVTKEEFIYRKVLMGTLLSLENRSISL